MTQAFEYWISCLESKILSYSSAVVTEQVIALQRRQIASGPSQYFCTRFMRARVSFAWESSAPIKSCAALNQPLFGIPSRVTVKILSGMNVSRNLTLLFVFFFEMSGVLDQQYASGPHDHWTYLRKPWVSDLLRRFSNRRGGFD